MMDTHALVGSVYDCDNFAEYYSSEADVLHDYEGLAGQSFTRWVAIIDCVTGEVLHSYKAEEEDEDDDMVNNLCYVAHA